MVANIRSGATPGGTLYYNKEKVDRDEAEILYWQKMLEPFDKHRRMDVDACMEFPAVPRSQPTDDQYGLPCFAEPLTGGQTDRRTAPGNRLRVHGAHECPDR